ncbi:MAG: potassium channel family protein [Proteobacteria bacterium]|nr:potassium channel family protein [Pseudomonadota bacterium]
MSLTVRKASIGVLAAAVVLVAAGVVVFRYGLNLDWVNAVYFVITTITTVGYGDINLGAAPAAIKLFGTFLMITGAASMAALFGLVTDTILGSRLREIFGTRRRSMRDHIVLCGLGNVGYRVLEHLRRLGREVAVVEQDEDGRFVAGARRLGAEIVIGDIRLPETLERAHVAQAGGLIAVTDEDLANLEAALNARAVNPSIRVVLRMFDPNLAEKVRQGFGIQTALSTSALAAPAFALAAVDPSVIGSFYAGGELMLNLEITVGPGSALAGMTTLDLGRKGHVSVLIHESKATGRRELHPSDPVGIEAGDRLVLSTVPDFMETIHQLNRPRE